MDLRSALPLFRKVLRANVYGAFMCQALRSVIIICETASVVQSYVLSSCSK